LGRLFRGFYNSICCPDPCYEPRWIAVANSAFFVDAARPQTQTRFRWDSGFDLEFPDRAEFFWAKQGGKGPRPPAGRAVSKLRYGEFSMYTEGATGRVGAFVEIPYRSTYPDIDFLGDAGFADMNVGTKTLLLDSELLQVAFQFRTFIPTAAPNKGLGTGHTSLEPSLLYGLRLDPDTYLQCQFAHWIPIGGDGEYQGETFHYHFSLNRVLYRMSRDIQLIGTGELNGWVPLDGLMTDPGTGVPIRTKGDTLVSAGPGLRLVFCDKIDFGCGAAFAITNHHWAEQLIRAEFRWRF
jgi:hypothetical protein